MFNTINLFLSPFLNTYIFCAYSILPIETNIDAPILGQVKFDLVYSDIKKLFLLAINKI